MKISLLITSIRTKRNIAWSFLAIIMASYATPLVQELDDQEPYPDYYNNILPIYMGCDLTQFFDIIKITNRNFLKEWFNCFSYKVLGNDRVLPFAFSIGLVYLVYLLGHSITNDRLIGLIASLAFSINPMLTRYDTSPTYDQAWAFFVILSVVLLYRKSIIGPLCYPLAIASKALAIVYLPAMLYNIISEPIRHKKLSFGIVISLVVFGVSGVLILGYAAGPVGIFPERLGDGLFQLFIHLRIVLPILGLFAFCMIFFKPKMKITGTRIVYVWMIWILLTTPLLYVLTQDFQFSYRYVPFAAFMSVFVGIGIINFGNKLTELMKQKKDLIDKRSMENQ